MMRSALLAAFIGSFTAVFGLAAIAAMILIPTGDPLLWFARPWARLIAWSCGVSVAAEGAGRIPRGRPCVYMSNHQSHFDVPALILALPGQYRILAKRELFFIPIFGWALWLAGCVPVDRSRRERAIESVNRAAEKVRRGRSVLIFAEGTRSVDGSLRPLKKGGFHLAVRSGAPIVPVSVRGSREILPKGGRRIGRGPIRVTIGDPIETAGRAPDTLGSLMEQVRAAIEAGLRPRVAAAETL
jgi:1-acyl-sn-glycerol-3-phosphate acyltransferase